MRIEHLLWILPLYILIVGSVFFIIGESYGYNLAKDKCNQLHNIKYVIGEIEYENDVNIKNHDINQTSYYFSLSGIDNNNCTDSNPCKSISEVSR